MVPPERTKAANADTGPTPPGARSSAGAPARPNFRIFGLWRLTAAILIMIYHFAHHAAAPEAPVAFLERLFPLLDMFFMMSGFLIMAHYREMGVSVGGWLRFLAKRLSRLYPLHFITLSVFVAMALAVSAGLFRSQGAEYGRYAFDSLASNLLLLHAWGTENELTFNYVSWSVSAEWFAYILFPAALLLTRKAGLLALGALTLATIAVLEIAGAHGAFGGDPWYDTRLFGAYRVLADFLVGMLLCSLVLRARYRLASQAPAFLAMALAVALMYATDAFYPVFAAMALAIYLAALVERNVPDATRWSEPLMPVAAVSFGVYLWHPVVELFAYSLLWNRILNAPDALFWPFMVLPVIATIVVALLSARHLEKPAAMFLEGLLLRGNGPRKPSFLHR